MRAFGLVLLAGAVLTTRATTAAVDDRSAKARVILASGLEIVIRDAYVKDLCPQRGRPDPDVADEVSEILYWERIGSTGRGAQRRLLLHGEPPISLRRVVFAARGRIERIEFSNHTALDSAHDDVMFAPQVPALGCVAIAGRSIAQEAPLPSGQSVAIPQMPVEVFYPVDRLREVVFEGRARQP